MNKELFRIVVGLSVIIVHSVCFLSIFYLKSEYLSEAQKLSMALLFMPVTAAYVVAIIRSAVDRATEPTGKIRINLNYALIVSTFTVVTLGGLLWTVANLQGAQEADRQTILLFEIAFGAGFGLIASDLFGKVERVEVRGGEVAKK